MVVDAPETKIVDTFRIACDGGGEALGHPKVWLQIPTDRDGLSALIVTVKSFTETLRLN